MCVVSWQCGCAVCKDRILRGSEVPLKFLCGVCVCVCVCVCFACVSVCVLRVYLKGLMIREVKHYSRNRSGMKLFFL